MAETDLMFADRLRDMAGWNQRLQDWKRLLRHDPQGCFVAEWHGQPAGTATTTTYSKDLAWIGMVLVDSDMRRRGIGKALLMQCIEHLRQSGVGCIKLDATPLGRQVYGPLGFVSEWSLSRWQTTELSVCPERIETASDPGSRPLDSGDIGCVADLDACAFGVARNRMLSLLATQSETRVHRDGAGRIVGYGMLRPGQRAYYRVSDRSSLKMSRAASCWPTTCWEVFRLVPCTGTFPIRIKPQFVSLDVTDCIASVR